MLFGWLIPLIIVMFNLCFEYENYGGDYHCWLQMDTNLIYGQFVPIAFMTIISLAIIEAAGEGAGSKKLQNVDEQQRKTAKIMQRTLVLILPTVRIPTYFSNNKSSFKVQLISKCPFGVFKSLYHSHHLGQKSKQGCILSGES